MADKALKISELTALTSISGGDLLVIVDDPTGTPTTKKVTVANLLGNSSANVVIQNVTPANGTITVTKGTIMFDSSFIYIATANNVIKKVALSAF
jgi:hypothetical protein